MSRQKRGYVFMDGRKHFVYEGLNLIGRQKDATIIIPDINISHQHSVIVIISEHHYLGDTNSSNGTYLKQLKLCSMQLHELQNGDAIRFGLLDAKYFKLENDVDSGLENVEKPFTQIEDNIFNMATQLYDAPVTNLRFDIHTKLVEPQQAVTVPLGDSKTVSINDLPTQIIVDENDSLIEDEANFNNISVSNILINDLPTQIVVHEKDDDSSYISDVENCNADNQAVVADIIEDTIVNDNNSNDENLAEDGNSKESVDLVTMQPVSESQSQLFVGKLRRRVRNMIGSSSDEECSGSDGQRSPRKEHNADVHDENSSESLDLVTMQPVASQYFSSESQLHVHELRNRIRNVIASSDDEDSQQRKLDAKRKSSQSSSNVRDLSSDDDETDVEANMSVASPLMNEKKRSLTNRNKSVVDTDSDGEGSSSTDAEEELKRISEKAVVAELDTVTNEVPTGDTKEENEEACPTDCNNDMLDDSDIIPSTQVTESHRFPTKSASQTTANLEASVPFDSSFNLILTSSPPSSVVASVADRVTGNGTDCDAETEMNAQTTERDDKLDNPESQRTQLEVSFDEDLTTETSERDIDTGRPPNPLVNVFETVASLSTSPSAKPNDSIEEKLSKLFASQVAEKDDDDDDSVFLVPTQIIKEQATFAVPTQKMIPPRKTAPQIKENTSAANTDKKRDEKEIKRVDLREEDTEDDDIFLQPTQMLTNTAREADNIITERPIDEPSVKEKVVQAEEGEIKDIFLQPTQAISNKLKSTKEDVKNSNVLLESVTVRDDNNDDIFLQPTQMLPESTEKSSHITESKNKNAEDENVDIFLQPTQVVSDKVKDTEKDDALSKVKNSNISSESATTKDDKNDNDIFLQPTQMLPELTEKSSDITESKNKTAEDENVDIFLQPTQTLTNISKRTDITSEGSIDEASTNQKVAQGDDDENEDIFLQPTQVVLNKVKNAKKDDDALNQVKNSNISSESLTTRDDNNDGDDIFLQPTQMLPELTEKTPEITKSKNGKVSLAEINAKDEIATTVVPSTNNPVGGSEKSNAPKEQLEEISDEAQEAILQEQRSLKMKTRQNPMTGGDVFSKTAHNIGDTSSDESESIRIIENDIFSVPTQVLESTYKSNDSKNANEGLIKLSASSSDMKQGEKVTDNASVMTTENKTLRSGSVEPVDGGNRVQNTSVKRRQLRSEVESPAKKLKTRNEEKRTPSTRGSKRKQSVDGEDALSNATDCVPSSSHSSLDTGIYVIKEISELAGNFPDKDNNNSEDEFERKDKLKTPSPPKTPKRSKRSKPLATQSEKTTATRLRQKKAERAEAKATSDEVTSACSSAAASVSSSEQSDVTTPAKQRKVRAEETVNPQSVRQRPNRKIKVDSKDIIPHAKELPSDSHETEISRMKQEDVHLDDKTETTRKSGRNTRVKQKTTKKDIEDEIEAPSSDSSHKTDTDVENTRTRKSRATTKGKAVERKSSADEDESSRGSGDAAGVKEVKSRRGRVNSATKEDEVKTIKDNKKISTAASTATSSSFITSTPERTKRKLKPKVVFTMLDSPELETIIRTLGGFVVDSVDTCTVLLTSSAKRSLKLLSAIGQGKPICSPKWLHESKKANAFLDPWDYILEDHEAEKKWDFSLKESLKRGGERKLLANYVFQIMVNTAQDVLKGAIECCGGKCVTRAPSKDNRTNFFIIASPENRNKYARFLKEKVAPKIIAAEAIFDAVLRQELHFEDHELT